MPPTPVSGAKYIGASEGCGSIPSGDSPNDDLNHTSPIPGSRPDVPGPCSSGAGAYFGGIGVGGFDGEWDFSTGWGQGSGWGPGCAKATCGGNLDPDGYEPIPPPESPTINLPPPYTGGNQTSGCSGIQPPGPPGSWPGTGGDDGWPDYPPGPGDGPGLPGGPGQGGPENPGYPGNPDGPDDPEIPGTGPGPDPDPDPDPEPDPPPTGGPGSGPGGGGTGGSTGGGSGGGGGWLFSRSACNAFCDAYNKANGEGGPACNGFECNECTICRLTGALAGTCQRDEGAPCECNPGRCKDCTRCANGTCQDASASCLPAPDPGPSAPDPTDPDGGGGGGGGKCETTSVCQDNSGKALKCPDGYKNVGSISSGNGKCLICEKCIPDCRETGCAECKDCVDSGGSYQCVNKPECGGECPPENIQTMIHYHWPLNMCYFEFWDDGLWVRAGTLYTKTWYTQQGTAWRGEAMGLGADGTAVRAGWRGDENTYDRCYVVGGSGDKPISVPMSIIEQKILCRATRPDVAEQIALLESWK